MTKRIACFILGDTVAIQPKDDLILADVSAREYDRVQHGQPTDTSVAQSLGATLAEL